MKKFFCILHLLGICTLSFAQNTLTIDDVNKNEGFFNITQFRFIKNSEIKLEQKTATSSSTDNLDASKSITWGLQTINGVFLGEALSLGIGLGLDGYHNPNHNTSPLFLDVRWYAPYGDTNYLYIVGGIGILTRWNEEFRKGDLLRIGLGSQFILSKNLVLVFDISYEKKNISLTDEPFLKSDRGMTITGACFSLGFIF